MVGDVGSSRTTTAGPDSKLQRKENPSVRPPMPTLSMAVSPCSIVESSPAATSIYMWGDRLIEFHHCRMCGCTTHYQSRDRAGARRTAVNARLMDPADIESTRIRRFDGASSWTFLDE